MKANNQIKKNELLVGTALTLTTIALLLFIETSSDKNVDRVASFVAGMFGFTAIQAFRQTFE